MTRRWRGRLVLTAAVALVACITMLLLGMHPRLGLVGGIVLVIASIGWLVLDVGPLAEEIDWERHSDQHDIPARPDRRVNLIRLHLHRERRDPDGWAPTADRLADLIDARLRSFHGIDRAADPDAAANALGPDLEAFLDDPEVRRHMVGVRALPATITLIEQL